MTLECVEIETGKNPRHVVIWLHGLGADGHDFGPIVPDLAGAGMPPIRFVFPHAPVRRVTINGGMPMRAWYDITGMEIAQRQDEDGMRASIVELEALIAREVARGIAPRDIVLAGFSQGAAMVLCGGLRHAARLGGIIALSGYLPLHEKLADERSAANADVPILIAHGSIDPVVPQPLGMLARDFLRGLGYRVEWKGYAMAHQVCAEEIADLREFLAARFAA